jgi:CubicO group peptidase (beta-lactamase class C family)
MATVPSHLELDPERAGFDPERLARLDRHLDRYVQDGRLPGWQVLVARDGALAHLAQGGLRDVEAGLPVEPDTVWRIFSMTKPITSVAAMMLWEEGAFELKDPVHRFLPAFRDMRVFRGGSSNGPETEPATEPVRMWHLLTHTAGLTYGFHYAHPVDTMYRDRGYEWGVPPGVDLAAACEQYASFPLLFHPGTEWNYSVASDVVGRVVEVIAGAPLDVVLAERVLRPLGMDDTAFWAAEGAAERLAALYTPDPDTGRATRFDRMGAYALRPPDCLSGGGGLVSTIGDYHRFTRMLLGGGELEGLRLLGPRTLALMTSNQLPGGADLEDLGRRMHSETTFEGVGFGLGFSVVRDPVGGRFPASPGEFAWGGAASTAFWVDPVERLTVIFMTQLLPSSTYSLRAQVHQLVHQALVG